MGTYTEHWNNYLRASKKKAVLIVLFLVIGLPGTALIPHLISLVTGHYSDVLLIVLIGLWLVIFTVAVIRSTKVPCPRCGTRYGQSKWQRSCPSCGLKILQEEP